MKRIHFVGVLCVVLALAATASAQDSLSKFVITGEAAKKIHDFTTINLATAERIVETCEGLAQKENVGVTIYILDNDGNHVYMDRMDGQNYLGIVTAEMKARTALAERGPSKGLANRISKNPDSELQQILLGLFPNSGALPIIVNDQLIGVIGIGGSAPRIAAASAPGRSTATSSAQSRQCTTSTFCAAARNGTKILTASGVRRTRKERSRDLRWE
jgi:uncharacterized protein GlcG (DUF336 family)